jgi:ParB-like chromosome segregation protein Spo0J
MEIRYYPIASLKEWGYAQKLFGSLQDKDFARLVDSVRQRGILTPVAVRPDRTILCGHHRVQAAREAGLSEVPCVEVTLSSEIEYQLYAIDDNLERRHMSGAQRGLVFLERKKLLEDLRSRGQAPEDGRIRDLAAEGLGVSGRQAVKYEKIASRLPQDVVEMVDRGVLGVESASVIATHCNGDSAATVARKVVAGGLSRREAAALAKAYARDQFSVDPALDPGERLRLGVLMSGLAQIIEASATEPARLVGSCAPAELASLGDLAARAEAYLRSLRKEVTRELTIRSAYPAGERAN